MEPFTQHTGKVVPYDMPNVDTDQIIPARFLKKIDRVGFGELLFHDLRFDTDGSEKPGFILNEPRYQGGSILVSGPQFGIGSSREHAPWALQQYGFHSVIARIGGGNEASTALHAKHGFSIVGIERQVGRKFNRWVDVTVMQVVFDDQPT